MSKKSTTLRNIISFLWIKNPLLIYGLSVVTAVMTTTSLNSALAVCLALLIMMIPTTAVALVMGSKLPPEIRFVIHTLVASLSYIPAAMAVRALFPQAVTALTIYLPLLAVNELVVLRADRYAKKRSVVFALTDTLGCILSFTLTMLFIAFVRELLGSGSLFGYKMLKQTNPEFLLPFMGFIISGFTAALFKHSQAMAILAIRRRRYKKARKLG